MTSYIKFRVHCHSISLKGIALALIFIFLGCNSKKPDSTFFIPKAPTQTVYEETKTLNEKALTDLQSVLIEHDRLTGEQFLIGIFKQLGNSNIQDVTHQIFLKWNEGKRGQNTSILLAFFLKEQKAKIETGYKLSSILGDERAQEIADSIHLQDQTDSGSLNSLGEAVFEILKSLNSPLVQSGKAEVLLAKDGPNTPNQTQASTLSSETTIAPPNWGWGLLFLLGLSTFSMTLFYLLSREAHFTRSGWYRPNLALSLKELFHNRNRREDETGGASGYW